MIVIDLKMSDVIESEMPALFKEFVDSLRDIRFPVQRIR